MVKKGTCGLKWWDWNMQEKKLPTAHIGQKARQSPSKRKIGPSGPDLGLRNDITQQDLLE